MIKVGAWRQTLLISSLMLAPAIALPIFLSTGDIELVENSGIWSTYPYSSSPPGWLINDSNTVTGAFYYGVSSLAQRSQNGAFSETHSVEGSYQFRILSSTQPASGSKLRIDFAHKIAGQVQVALLREESANGSSGQSRAEVRCTPDDVIFQQNATFGVASTFFNPNGDGWKSKLSRHHYSKPIWTHVGADWVANVRIYAPGAKTSSKADSPVNGADVNSTATAKSHLTPTGAIILSPSVAACPEGTLTLSDWSGSGELPLIIEFVATSDGLCKVIGEGTVRANGAYFSGNDLADGTYDIYITVKGFLRKKFSNIAFVDHICSGLNATLTNGDANHDNAVNLLDYSLVSANMGLDETSTTWDRMDENFNRPRDCDLNGDGEVNLADYAIVTTNYNQEGD